MRWDISGVRRRAGKLREKEKAADDEDERRDQKTCQPRHRPGRRLQYPGARYGQKRGIDDEWREEQRDLGDNGPDHAA